MTKRLNLNVKASQTLNAFSCPLKWPAGWDRTPASNRIPATSTLGYLDARDYLLKEITLFGGKDIEIYTSIPLMSDSKPFPGREDDPHLDPGIAAYFTMDEQKYVIACDDWNRARDNLRTAGMLVGYLRAAKRVGGDRLMARALTAFHNTGTQAQLHFDAAFIPKQPLLAAPKVETSGKVAVAVGGSLLTEAEPTIAENWWEVLHVASNAPRAVVEAAFKALAKEVHPDQGGADAAMQRLTSAVHAARAAVLNNL